MQSYKVQEKERGGKEREKKEGKNRKIQAASI
jgi:hypothetical protein